MTVKELIEQLQQFSQETPVYLTGSWWHGPCDTGVFVPSGEPMPNLNVNNSRQSGVVVLGPSAGMYFTPSRLDPIIPVTKVLDNGNGWLTINVYIDKNGQVQ